MSSITSPSSMSSLQESRDAVRRGHVARVGLATIVAATLANVVVYYVGNLFVTYVPEFLVLNEVVGIAVFTLVPTIVAVLLYAALLRFTRRPERIFAIVSAIVFVVTTIPDFTYLPTLPGATNGQIVVLVLMHVVAAVVIVGMLTRLTRPRTR